MAARAVGLSLEVTVSCPENNALSSDSDEGPMTCLMNLPSVCQRFGCTDLSDTGSREGTWAREYTRSRDLTLPMASNFYKSAKYGYHLIWYLMSMLS